MRKEAIILVLGIIAALALLTSCIPGSRYYVCSDGRKVLNPSECVAQQPMDYEPAATGPEPVPGQIISQPVRLVISDEAKALFDKIGKVSSVYFYYLDSPDSLPENKYYMSRDKMKIMLKTKIKFDPTNLYDTVYLDLIAKTALGYCEDRSVGFCPDRDKAYKLDFSDYIIVTPFDWVAMITKANLTGRSKMIEKKTGIEVSFEINGKPGIMYADSFYGVPLYVTYNGKYYEYRDLVANMVDSKDLAHQFTPP
jgi:hypothetical protein